MPACKAGNEKWCESKVIISDEDFAERSVFKEKFSLAPMQICLYHVLKNFDREVTTKKRNITEEQKNKLWQ